MAKAKKKVVQKTIDDLVETPVVKKYTFYVDRHPTELVTIKSARIDVKMIPLINWMNSYESVTTLFCCQGEDSYKQPPYVLWTCTQSADLVVILNQFRYTAKTEIEWHEFKNHLQYYTTFKNETEFDRFVDLLTARLREKIL